MNNAYRVSVRALCEFTAKSGDLDLRFTPSPSAREGMEGHSWVTQRRHREYETEVPLEGKHKALTVRGRADGYDPIENRLEEIKTFRGELDLMPDNHRALHWAQVKIYGWLLCQQRKLDSLTLTLVYFDVVKQKETHLSEDYSAEALYDYFNEQCQKFLAWAEQEMAHRQARDVAMNQLAFPYADFRTGQRPLAEAVYQSAATGSTLLAEAPTGIGKTLGTLFPLLKAMPSQGLDKVFFLTAKTPGRRLALDALDTLAPKPVRTLELIAREKSCEHPDKACHGDSCPLAQGFYDRLPGARKAAAEETTLNQARLRELALEHNICPYYLGQEMARWSDVVVGDYNYYFDMSAMLYGLTTSLQWRVAVLVDEAHNLVERARSMYTAELDQLRCRRIKSRAPKVLKPKLEKLNREWNAINRDQKEVDYSVLSDLPQNFSLALQSVIGAITDYLAEHPFGLNTELMQFYFDTLQFQRTADLFDEDTYLFDLTWIQAEKGRKGTRLCLRNLIPAQLLRPRFETAHATTLFSATLKPSRYYRDLLGLPEHTVNREMTSPFTAAQLQVRIASGISTRYADRSASVEPISELIAQQYEKAPGNYLAFFSSYQYLNQVLSAVQAAHPDIPVWSQNRQMDEAAREAFLAEFQEHSQGVGFAVLGGAFAEGIDLPGTRLIGAFVATLGLPQMNDINQQLRQRLEQVFGEGYDYTYLYPGMRKVVQAAGRVIRSEQDRGVVHLIDDRYHQPRIRALLPHWWHIDNR